MPPRLPLVKKRYSTFDLPILPFLAPSVFEPWPTSHRKYAASIQSGRNHTVAAPVNYDNKIRDEEAQKSLGSFYLGGQQQGKNLRDGTSENASNIHSLDCSKPRLKEPGNIRRGTPKSFSAPLTLHEPVNLYSIGKTPKKQNITSLLRPLKSCAPINQAWRLRTLYVGSRQKSKHVEGNHLITQARSSRLPATQSLSKPGPRRLKTPRQMMKRSRLDPQENLSSMRSRTQPKPLQPLWMKKWHGLMLSLDQIRPGMINKKLNRIGDPSASRIFQSLVDEMLQLESIEQFKEAWLEMGLNRQLAVWPELMVTALAYYPEKALPILEVTSVKKLPHLYISDSLHCIIEHYLRGPNNPPQDFVLDMASRICKLLLSNISKIHPRLSQTSIYIMLQKLPLVALKELSLTLAKTRQYLSNDTLIQFASRLAKRGETDLAFKLARQLKGIKEADVSKVLSLCTTMLQNCRLDLNTQYRESNIFQLIQDYGLTPNIITYNVLILNAIKDGNYDTAWKIHDMMVDTGIETDEFTYSILLTDAKLRNDSMAMETVMGFVFKRHLNNAYIFTDVLHAIHLMSLGSKGRYPSITSRDFGSVFEHMLQVYCEHFHVEPLIRIIPQLSGFISPPSNPDIVKDLMTPAAATMVVMVTGFLRFGQAYHAQRWYAHFRHLVISGDAIVKDMITDTYIYNVILMTYQRHPELRSEAPKIIADMLAPTEGSEDGPIKFQDRATTEKVDSSNIEVQLGRPHIPPRPDVFTWTILLQIFMIQQHPRAAEKVLAMMMRRDAKPDMVTWNSLVTGYSRLQDAERTADAIHRLEAAGFKPDHETYGYLSNVNDRAALSKSLKKKKVVVGGSFMDQLGQEVLASELEKRMRDVY